MKRRTLILGGAAALAAGCGGGGGVSLKPGRAVFTIAWPEKTTRLIPQASQSVAVEIRQGTTVLERKVMARPATTAIFDNLPEGDLIAIATAHPNRDGTGVAQAIGVAPLAIRDGETTQVPLTMASTIVGFSLAFTTLGVGETRRLIGTFRDAQNAVVLVSPSQGEYSVTGNTGSISFDTPNRLATGIAPGQVQIQIRNVETGTIYSASFEVINAPTLPDVLEYAPGRLADAARYLIWHQDYASGVITAFDPDTSIPVRSLQVGAYEFLAGLSHAGNYMFFTSGSKGKILDINSGQMLPGEISVSGSNVSLYRALNSPLSSDQSFIVLSKLVPSGLGTLSIFDGFIQRPATFFTGELSLANFTGSDSFHYISTSSSNSTNWRVSQHPISASGLGVASNAITIDGMIRASTESLLISSTRKVYATNNLSFIRELAPTPVGTSFSLSNIEDNLVHSVIEIPGPSPISIGLFYYSVHDVNSGSLLHFSQLPHSGIVNTTSTPIYGYAGSTMLRHYIYLRSTAEKYVLKRKFS